MTNKIRVGGFTIELDTQELTTSDNTPVDQQLESIKRLESLIMECEKTDSVKIDMLKLVDRYKKITLNTIDNG
jgi:hypothetical protein